MDQCVIQYFLTTSFIHRDIIHVDDVSIILSGQFYLQSDVSLMMLLIVHMLRMLNLWLEFYKYTYWLPDIL